MCNIVYIVRDDVIKHGIIINCLLDKKNTDSPKAARFVYLLLKLRNLQIDQ